MLRVAVLGLGRMGAPVAMRLRAAGFPTEVWNRTASCARNHAAEHGTRYVPRLDALDSEIIVSFLPDTPEVLRVMEAVRWTPVRAWIDGTSGRPQDAPELVARAAGHGAVFVDAPVSGGPAGAAAGTLTAFVGNHLPRLEAVLWAYCARIMPLGPSGAGYTVKALNNWLNASHLTLAAQAAQAAQQQGLDPAAAMRAISASSGQSVMTRARVPQEVLTGAYNYGFSARLMHKDLVHARALVPGPWTDSLLQLAAQVPPEADYTHLARVVMEARGFPRTQPPK